MDRMRTTIAAVLVLGVSMGPASFALSATELPFSQQAFVASQREGKPILIHITAPWCPYCAKQQPILSELMKEPSFEKLVVYDVDFDTQKDVIRALGVQKQSTLIAFRGGAERGRSTGMTDPIAIRMLLQRTNEPAGGEPR